jgi:hypothetical protein
MKRYIYLTLTVILLTVSWNFDWFFAGQTAIEAVKQVKTGFDYQQGVAMVKFWTGVKTIIDIASAVFFLLFIFTLKPKTNKDETK